MRHLLPYLLLVAGCRDRDLHPLDLDAPGTALFARTTVPYGGDTLILVLAEDEGDCSLVETGNINQLYYTVRGGLFAQMRPDWVIGTDGGLEGLYVDAQVKTYFGDDLDEDIRGTVYTYAMGHDEQPYMGGMYVPSWIEIYDADGGAVTGEMDAWLWKGTFALEDCGTVEYSPYYYYYD